MKTFTKLIKISTLLSKITNLCLPMTKKSQNLALTFGTTSTISMQNPSIPFSTINSSINNHKLHLRSRHGQSLTPKDRPTLSLMSSKCSKNRRKQLINNYSRWISRKNNNLYLFLSKNKPFYLR